jgi:hypothetical protein
MPDGRFLRNVVLKALILFIALNVLLVFWDPLPGLGRLSLYNFLFPGRERFPFGETPQLAYNFSLYNLNAMFASHQVSAAEPEGEEPFRLFIVGDSSVWGTLLTPDQTLAGQINAMGLTACDGRPVEAFNLGYPTISLFKDVTVMNQAAQYDPDLVLWLTTLEAFPTDRQFESPIVANNPERVDELIAEYGLSLDPNDPAVVRPDWLERTLWGLRRPLADWLRLQMYGVMWASTGIDQYYPDTYEPAARDLEADDTYHDLQGVFPDGYLDWELLAAGQQAAGAPLWLVNEPILISTGANSDIRYNFFYPIWAYDLYRRQLANQAQQLGLNYLDAWDIIPESEFTNSAIHLSPAGEQLLAEWVAQQLTPALCP